MTSDGNDGKSPLMVELNCWLEAAVERLSSVRTPLVFISSVITVALSLLFSFWLRFEFSFPEKEALPLFNVLILAVLVKMAVFYFFRLYEGMWKYVSISDLVRIFSANLVASSVVVGVVLLWHTQLFAGFARATLAIDFFICFLAMSGKRVLVRIVRESAAKAVGGKSSRTLIVGDVSHINSFLQAMSSSPSRLWIVGMLCDEGRIGRTIRGVPILGRPSRAAKCAQKHRASEMILLPPHSNPATIKSLLDDMESRSVKCSLRMLPAYTDIADGSISVSNIKEVEIEDLLGRKPVSLDRTEVSQFIRGKSVMVSGAGGSIGSELCRQIAAYKPSRMVLFELSEYNLYEVSMSIRRESPDIPVVSILGDVRCEENLMRAMASNNVQAVYHAAAYKHVPLVEDNPSIAFATNVLGSANVAKCAEAAGAARVVMISTDKAVRPTSVMGATKRLAERTLLERPLSKTEFVAVRFGNVLGSSGSVIPLFKRQIKDGGPVTVTSPNVVRYFMSIPEAVDLVLQAGAIGRDRDVMVLEMGEPVRIHDMARRLIELSGFIPEKDVKIVFTGLRPGEKEYEELLTAEEQVDRTPYEKIYVARKEAASLPPVDLPKVASLVAENDAAALKSYAAAAIPDNLFGLSA